MRKRRVAAQVLSEIMSRAPHSADVRVGVPGEARSVLARKVTDVLTSTNGAARREGIVRITVPLEETPDLLAWLRLRPEGARSYWSGRRDGQAVAASGEADVVEGRSAPRTGELRKALEARLAWAGPGVRYFGGLRFDAARRADRAWEPFGAYRFVLPRFEVVRNAGGGTLVCNVVLPRDRERVHDLLEEIERLATPATPLTGTLPLPVDRTDEPDFRVWQDAVRTALRAFDDTTLEKVVLARQVGFRFEDDLDPFLLLERLQEATPNCFHYLFEPEAGYTFLGATPERLFRREGRSVWSEAVAGTRPRGTTRRDDDQLRDELLHSEKDLREHAYVRDSIRAVLEPLTEHLQIDAMPSEMPLARGRHLYTGMRGRLREGVSTFTLLERLHPTPAVGGYPRDAALDMIRTLEPFDRGWYAGPVGWVGDGVAEFAVALRCGRVAGRQLSLFSGAGLVRGSTPEAEWDEIEHKIVDFLRVMGLDLRRAE
ncbi:MAG: isochorismate synthase [Rhodothermaceae bacterium]|nr:MAG: isochorismate synthase [Rhodothermaceae bacterium]